MIRMWDLFPCTHHVSVDVAREGGWWHLFLPFMSPFRSTDEDDDTRAGSWRDSTRQHFLISCSTLSLCGFESNDSIVFSFSRFGRKKILDCGSLFGALSSLFLVFRILTLWWRCHHWRHSWLVFHQFWESTVLFSCFPFCFVPLLSPLFAPFRPLSFPLTISDELSERLKLWSVTRHTKAWIQLCCAVRLRIFSLYPFRWHLLQNEVLDNPKSYFSKYIWTVFRALKSVSKLSK